MTPEIDVGGVTTAGVFQGYASAGMVRAQHRPLNDKAEAASAGGAPISQPIPRMAITRPSRPESWPSNYAVEPADDRRRPHRHRNLPQDLPGQTVVAGVSASDAKMVAGGAIYADECSASPRAGWQGRPLSFSVAGRIAERPLRRSDEPHSRPHRRRAALRLVGEPTGPGMPSFAWEVERRSGRRGLDSTFATLAPAGRGIPAGRTSSRAHRDGVHGALDWDAATDLKQDHQRQRTP